MFYQPLGSHGQALAFKHLDVEVTAVKVAFFREALIEAAESREVLARTKKGKDVLISIVFI